jgi:HEAT repeat protein
MGNESPFELEVYYRLRRLSASYRFEPTHADGWRALLLDAGADLYARLCAAHFLLDSDDGARAFVRKALQSKEPGDRNNAAKLIQMYVGGDPAKAWGVDLMIEALSSGAIDGPAGESTCSEGGCERHRTPVDAVCRDLGRMKVSKAAPALLALLSRRPRRTEAAVALGELGDPRAKAELLRLVNAKLDDDRTIAALGKLKATEAVPIFVGRLGHPRTTFSGLDVLETKTLLEALRDIGDRSAVPAIRRYAAGPIPPPAKAAARRVIAQLAGKDPSAELIALLRDAPDEPAQSGILADLARYPNDRAIGTLERIARTDESAFLRREAIRSLASMKHRTALLALCGLLSSEFPGQLRAEWGWKEAPPDFSVYFHELLAEQLESATGQTFGADPKGCRTWVVGEFPD